jgi:hypothetical protein
MKKIFITFAAGSQNYLDAGNRIIKQAEKLQVFDQCILYTDEYLKNDKSFWDKHSTFILNNKKGFGYWLWKPYIIKKTIETMEDNDILVYLDAGCEINIHSRDKMLKCFETHIIKDNIIGSEAFDECIWTKMDLILRLDMLNNSKLTQNQAQGGTNMFLICDNIRNLVNEWYEIAYEENYHYIDDTPSIKPNFPNFQEHRHDQSIFSLLTKKYNLHVQYSDFHACFHPIRNRTGISKFNYMV